MRFVAAAMLLLVSCKSRPGKPAGLDTAGFEKLLATVAAGWNTNNARMAADCFTEDALYSSPPGENIRKGRQALFEFFGGAQGRPQPMSMLWHHIVFDPAQQIGAGEYTFTYRIRTHGVAMIRVVNGKIANWREYEVESRKNWEEMVGENQF